MSIADAARVIAAREYLADMDIALRLLGFRLLPRTEAVEPEFEDTEPVTDEDDEVDDDTDDVGQPIPDPGIATDWGRAAFTQSFDTNRPRWLWDSVHDAHIPRAEETAGPRLVPYVLESTEILSTQGRRERLRIIDRPRSAPENEQFRRESLARYIDTWNRERMRQILRRHVPGKQIDVDEVVRLLAEGRPLRGIPVLRRSKVALPIQVIYDVGLFAGPFGLDLRAALEVIRSVSVPGVEHLAFRYRVAHGCGEGPVWRWQRYRLPSHKTSVVLISGSYGDDVRGRVREFHRLLAVLHRQGHQPRGLWFGSLPADAAVLRPRHWVARTR